MDKHTNIYIYIYIYIHTYVYICIYSNDNTKNGIGESKFCLRQESKSFSHQQRVIYK